MSKTIIYYTMSKADDKKHKTASSSQCNLHVSFGTGNGILLMAPSHTWTNVSISSHMFCGIQMRATSILQLWIESIKCVERWHFRITTTSPRGQWVKTEELFKQKPKNYLRLWCLEPKQSLLSVAMLWQGHVGLQFHCKRDAAIMRTDNFYWWADCLNSALLDHYNNHFIADYQ